VVLDLVQMLDQQVTATGLVSEQSLDFNQGLGVDAAALGRRTTAFPGRPLDRNRDDFLVHVLFLISKRKTGLDFCQ